MKHYAISLLLFCCCSCSTTPSGPPKPDWITQPTRTVDKGYIVYVGSGEDNNAERAKFKAEAMALQDLANECSFAPKGTRIEDHFSENIKDFTESYAKVAVEFQDCEKAKAALTPEAVQQVANVALAEQIKRYQDLIDHPEPDETPVPIAIASTSGSSTGSGPKIIQNDSEFFVMRQQVAYYKQAVILAPPGTYTPNSTQSTQFTQNVQEVAHAVNSYEVAHPQIHTWANSYSTHRMIAPPIGARAYPSRGSNVGGAHRQGRGAGGRGMRRRRF